MEIPNIKSTKYSVIPAGKDVFMVDSVSFDPEKNAIKVTYRLLNADRKHTEPYRLDVDFQVKALGNMVRAAYDDKSIDDITGDILEGTIGRQFHGKITHREWNGNTYAGIDAFSYKPVKVLYSFAKEATDVIHDEETASVINDMENIA